MYAVTKEYSFDAAHRLIHGYQGKCTNVHGHTFRVRIHARKETLNEFGFVFDFSDFAPVKQWIDNELDHATIMSADDDDLIQFIRTQRNKGLLIIGNPTSENLARIIFDKAVMLLPNAGIYAVEIDETCTSTARYEP
jgi:6-pyruvoyltetrahydropterin/6-carboxytetrahydropterin synthase